MGKQLRKLKWRPKWTVYPVYPGGYVAEVPVGGVKPGIGADWLAAAVLERIGEEAEVV